EQEGGGGERRLYCRTLTGAKLGVAQAREGQLEVTHALWYSRALRDQQRVYGRARCRPSRGWGPAGRGAPMKLIIKLGGYQEPASIHNRAAARLGELLRERLGA